ncbi:LysM peptidoglycan-binding domain-containing protein [Thalassotalea sp. LPB0316]|uniref:LysM peptidoglycan-binding domain-containing protein n=1 Tax=Thalassotalea sp. LPB0316 TaxID=2769490 RepID=UPI001865BEB6|nr:LysM domain-containing protein [Thalassotalea sp. LPB0316]QOL26407.1 LysM peptidoglycan-binding domain-containing protein [Thalassotalea sp. LPB0316]
MLKKIILTTISFLLPLVVLADQLTLKENAPKTYIVKKGDTLWDISGIFLNQPWLWPKLWRLNPEINNPHLIYPGDELRLVFDEQGQPMLVKGKPELKWTPKVRTQLKDLNPVETLPLNIIEPYIQYASVFDKASLDNMPYVLGSDEGYKSSVDGFYLYIKGNLTLGQSYAVYQKGDAIIDPQSQEVLGHHTVLVGTGKTLREGDIDNNIPATLYLDGIKREVRSGDVVLPVHQDQQLPSYYTMQSASSDLSGAIIHSASGVREFGKLEVVMINLGESQGVKLGDVFSIGRVSPGVVETKQGPVYTQDASRWHRMANKAQSDYNMPTETFGQMMVFKLYDKTAMALILNSTKPIRLSDIVKAP